jgi:hypothetical protein
MNKATTKWQNTTDAAGNGTREFVIESIERRTVTGALWLPQDPGLSRPGRARPGESTPGESTPGESTPGQFNTLMLFGHGASGDRYQAPICHLAERFVSEAQVPVLSLDGPVHGLRQVGPGIRTV